MRGVPVGVVVPLGGRHHLGHGGQKVVAGDGDGVDVQHQLLRRGVDLRVAAAQRAQGGLRAHGFDVGAAVTWRTKRRQRVTTWRWRRAQLTSGEGRGHLDRPNRNSRSKRPGLLSAGSMESSLFVAPITTTSPRPSNPSMSASRVDTMELRRTQGLLTGGRAGRVTWSKSRRSCRSDSPTHLLRQSAPFLMKKDTLRSPWLHSLASARATSVFPVPGGP
ncbi:hypothetical protein EYF80_053683 [Liparis tanakae]|uniref:Uncharacterized protein n=1 Tax=Liparis tanakae TaxID=230148 RepID=A0A4Z2F4J8_9TELE|nr:hypothetical protein EYF80_053683 [Liparis tanakae]